jgi:ATP-dependent DNA helicase RecG
MSIRDPHFLSGLLNELRKLPYECEWVEFKENYADHEDIGAYISALSNSAALLGKSAGYLVWGVNDSTHDITGTTFDHMKIHVGNE